MGLQADVEMTDEAIVYSLRTTDAGVQFFLESWRRLDEYGSAAQRGLYQSGYLILAGHMEGFLASMISMRLAAMSGTAIHPVHTMTPEQLKLLKPEPRESTPLERLHAAMRRFIEDEIDNLGTATFAPLEKLWRRLHEEKLDVVLGPELLAAVRAVFEIRNALAHGRTLTVHQAYGDEHCQSFGPYADGGNLVKTREILMKAKAMNPDANMAAYFPQAVLSEPTLRFFWGRVSEAQARLIASRDPIELGFAPPPLRLPALE
ncbi:MAG: hypothetical protein LCH79_16210 [Proteobacteria bacterium]|nr:hypothetical protein [Pseudomonadota bacterium]